MIKDNYSIIFGQKSTIACILSGKSINKIYLQRNKKNIHVEKIIQLSHQFHIPIQKVPLVKLNKLTNKNHQGVIAQISPINFSSLSTITQKCYEEGKDPLFIILDKITDVRNFGAIVRTALATAVDAIIIPQHHASAINEDAMKTSSGALAYVSICREKNLVKTLEYLAHSGIRIIACQEESKSSHNIYENNLTGPLAIIMGSEGHGISYHNLKKAQKDFFIPIFGPIDSLNVSVATAVILYEVIRQRKFGI